MIFFFSFTDGTVTWQFKKDPTHMLLREYILMQLISCMKLKICGPKIKKLG